jgi:hypothetical protein
MEYNTFSPPCHLRDASIQHDILLDVDKTAKVWKEDAAGLDRQQTDVTLLARGCLYEHAWNAAGTLLCVSG